MNPATPQPRDALIDQLSAYLDGELDAESSRRVEQMLASDPEARAELRRLKEAGEWLDELPSNEAAPNFAETTVSMVAVKEAEVAEEGASASGRASWTAWLGRSLTVLVAVGCGFALVAAVRPRPNDQLLENLPVLQNLEAFREADSLDFLRDLRARSLFAETSAISVGAPAVETTPNLIEERRGLVEHMDETDREQLLAKFERFKHLSSAEQVRVREVHDALSTAHDSAELVGIMMHYHKWLEELTAVQRTELLAMPPSRRLARIDELQTAESRMKKRKLNPDDAAIVADWIEQVLKRLPMNERQRTLFRLLSPRMQPSDLGRGAITTDFSQAREKLSSQAREMWTNASPPQRQELLALWVRQGMMVIGSRMNGSGDVDATPDRLRQFFEDMPETERERLLLLPGEEMQSELRRLYQLRSLAPGAGMGQGPGGGPRNGPMGRQRPNMPKGP